MPNENYFGLPDADSETKENINLYHVPNEIDKSVKALEKSDGKQIIVGIKGSGKTLLRRYIEESEDAIVFNLDSNHAYINIDASEIHESSGRLKNSLAFLLISHFGNFIEKDSKLKKAGKHAWAYIKKIPSALDIKTPVGDLDLKKILKPDLASVINSAWDDLTKEILDFLGEKKSYIMIDDTEDVFNKLEVSPNFIEALARAVKDINTFSKSKIHCLLFLKYGIWRCWYENQKEYDKVADKVGFLTWDYKSLCKIIAKRIAKINNLPFDNDNHQEEYYKDFWDFDFSWPNEQFDDFVKYITSYCVSGPRDIIVLCNLCKLAAGSNKIERKHINSALSKYSEQKIYELNADFGNIYKDIHHFIPQVFQGISKEFVGKELAEWVNDHAFIESNVDDLYRNSEHQWYKYSSKEQIVLILYKIGFIGKKLDNGNIQYAIYKPTESDLLCSKLVIHPAFHSYLRI